jgi:hypothetical protein
MHQCNATNCCLTFQFRSDKQDAWDRNIRVDINPLEDVWFKDLRRTLARAFPHLFLTGRGIANNITPKYVKHVLKFYDGRYEQDAEFVTTLFSLKMLSSTMVQGFRLRASKPGMLKEMGELINGGHLRELLLASKESSETRLKLERLLERYFGVFAGKTPFSSLTMATARGKMRGTRMRRNIGSQFITGAPPEHEDTTVLRLGVTMNSDKNSVLKNDDAFGSCGFNRVDCPMTSKDWTTNALKPFLLSDPNARIIQADRSPGLVALFFENQIKLITEKVLLCPLNGIQKSSCPRRGVCGTISAVECVVQLQSNRTQRLHYHIIARPHISNVRLFELSAAKTTLTAKARSFLNSVSNCALPSIAHEWWEEQMKLDYEDRQRTMTFASVDPRHHYEKYLVEGAKKIAMFKHEHSQTCTKTYRGQYLCRLGLARPVNNGPSAPKVSEMIKKSNCSKGERGMLKYSDVTSEIAKQLSRGLCFVKGEFVRPPLKWPIIWIQHRPERDKMVSEHNPIVAAELATSHNNQIASSNAGAENVDEYAISYVTPKNEYRNADSQFHFMCVAALDNMDKYPTKAPDADTDSSCRAARTFGMKVVNSVVGATEFSLPLMCYACLGHDAYESSEEHAYYYPISDVAEMNRCLHGSVIVDPVVRHTSITARLAALAQRDDAADDDVDGKRLNGEGTAYKCVITDAEGKKKTVMTFVTHGRLYATRPLEFVDMVSLELLCVAQVVPRTRKAARGEGHMLFEFSEDSPLKETHMMGLRRRQRTAVVAEHIPKFPGNRPGEDSSAEGKAAITAWEKEMKCFAEVVVPMFSPWSHDRPCKHTQDVQGFVELLTELNSSAATLKQKGRGENV